MVSFFISIPVTYQIFLWHFYKISATLKQTEILLYTFCILCNVLQKFPGLANLLYTQELLHVKIYNLAKDDLHSFLPFKILVSIFDSRNDVIA